MQKTNTGLSYVEAIAREDARKDGVGDIVDIDDKTPVERREGRPPRIPVTADLLMGVRKVHCTYEEAASFFGCSANHLRRLVNQTPEFKQAWTEGINAGNVSLRRLQWRHANTPGNAGVHMTIHLAKHWLGETDKSLIQHTGPDGGPVRVIDESLPMEERQRLYREELRKSKIGQLLLVEPNRDE